MNAVERWHSNHLEQDITVAKWGDFGTPVLIFPTAGGDAQEIERFQMIAALDDLLTARRIKVYSIDSIAGRSRLEKDDPRHTMWLQNQFDRCIIEEVVPAIRADCDDPDIEIVSAGASIGAFWALEVLARHPDVFRLAVCMSGSYDLTGGLQGYWSDEFTSSSPLHFVPELDGAHLDRLRERFVVLPIGGGRWEDPEESWAVANVLGVKGIPNRVDQWGSEWDHDWPTWRAMLPQYLNELV